MNGREWTQEEINYLKLRYSDTKSSVIADNLGRSLDSIYHAARKLKLKKSDAFTREMKQIHANRIKKAGKTTRLQRGHTPHNKNKKQREYMSHEAIERTKKTRFNHGHQPHNTKYNGYISIRYTKGTPYYWIRVECGNFKLLHRVIWERHYGPIPKGYNVIFKDGDQTNMDVNNLGLVSDAELMKKNTLHRFPKEMAELIQVSGALQRQINQILKDNNHE